MSLQLTRPLTLLDAETTGIIHYQDRIVQLGVIRLYPDGRITEWHSLVNPEIPIPPEATEVHKITDEMVKNAPKFHQLAAALHTRFQDTDFGGYNLKSFDLPLMKAEFARCGIVFDYSTAQIIDVFKMYAKLKPRNLTACVGDYATPEQVKLFLESPHNAIVDTRGTLHALWGMLTRHADIPRTPAEIHEYLFGTDKNLLCGGKLYFKNGEAVWAFGKWKGKTLKETPDNYLYWVAEKADFEPELKDVCRKARKREYPVPPNTQVNQAPPVTDESSTPM